MNYAIVGTAPTWRETPFQDASWTIASLNDAYALGLPRWSIWWELHPLDHFVFRPWKDARHTPITPNDIPAGYYLRPDGHLQWLKQQAQSIPVMLQQPPPPDWPMAARFEVERICEKFRDVLFIDPTWTKPYVQSGPDWMFLWALDHGFDHIGIWGIHLATEREYVDQRPRFEGLITYAIGKGVRITIPKGTPICHGRHVYCYEPRLNQAQDGLRYQLMLLDQQRAPLLDRLVHRPWWRGKQQLLDAIADIDAEKLDLKQRIARLRLTEEMAGPEWRL